jgi:phosphomannomutase
MSDIIDTAKAWIAGDPDPVTREELAALITQFLDLGDEAAGRDLGERFTGPLEFGTAGLRGVLGAGESRMNRAVVRRTTDGLARYLLREAPNAKERGVVIGYDGRRLSRELAEDTAGVLASYGIVAFLSSRPCPTPLTAFAVTKLGAAAGVMVTASHNPPEYNGFKVYWDNGAQIIPPHDVGIAKEIESAPRANEVKLLSLADAVATNLVRDLDHVPGETRSMEVCYLEAIAALSVANGKGDRALPIVYTPLHGVGFRLTSRALAAAGFTNVATVAEQQEPDGEFPTVRFPNPEEKGALDLALALANKHGAALIVANDPDVDRLALAVRDASGKYVQLTGNQVGVLLGHYLLTETTGVDRLVLASIVSSPMLGHIARAMGVHYGETLTGFKWIANRAMELEAKDKLRFVFGYEEALGYTAGDVVRDKDGIGAALIACELAATLKSEGKTLLNKLEELARSYGLFASAQKSMTLPGADGLAQIDAMMTRIRSAPPSSVGGVAVLAFADYRAQTRTKDGKTEKLELPPSNVLTFDLEGDVRIIARPSGTEPKIKFYFDLREPMRDGEAMADADARAQARIKALTDAFVAIAKG